MGLLFTDDSFAIVIYTGIKLTSDMKKHNRHLRNSFKVVEFVQIA